MEDTSFTENKKIELFIEDKFKSVDITKNIVERKLNFKKSYKSFFSNDMDELYTNFDNASNIHDFILNLFNLKNFKSFTRIHMLIHEKGEINSSNFEYTRDKSITRSKFNVDTFTDFFNSIKKSKDRSFGEINLKGTSFDILGTFLAQELTFRFHSVIFIISKDNFLPQEKEDKDFFHSLVIKLKIFLAPLVESTTSNDQLLSIDKALEYNIYPFHYYKNEMLIFSNTSSFLIDPIKFEISNNEYFLIEIDNHDILDKADIFHQERVNLLGDLFNTLKHELSNPLFGLQLTSELLLFEDLLEDQREFMSEINKSIKRSQDLIENFKDLYTADLEFKNINLIDLLKEVITLTKSKSRQLKIQFISLSKSLDLDNILINTNSSWLAQILFNFIVNSAEACEHLKDASLTISFTIRDQYLVINFLDNGPGVKDISSTSIFKPFYTTKSDGTGLGLSICKSLSLKLNGELNFIETSKGASFDLLLPYEYTDN